MSTRRKLAAITVAVVVGALAAELALRVLLFSEAAWIVQGTSDLRRPERYFETWSDEYWAMRVAVGQPMGTPRGAPGHPELGWLDPDLDGKTLRHLRDPGVSDARRLVLLYGDSFARGMTPPQARFENLLARSDLGGRYALLNFGVCGFGLDQIAILLQGSLPHYRERAPLVVIGLLIDDDLDRVVTSFREMPKPRFVLRGGELALARDRLPTVDEFFAENPLDVTSYVARWLVQKTPFVPDAWRARWNGRARAEVEIRELSLALLARICDELDDAQVERCFLIFSARERLEHAPADDWRSRLVRDYLDQRRVPYVLVSDEFAADREAQGRTFADYFFAAGLEAGHLNELGQEVGLRSIVEVLQGRFDGVAETR